MRKLLVLLVILTTALAAPSALLAQGDGADSNPAHGGGLTGIFRPDAAGSDLLWDQTAAPSDIARVSFTIADTPAADNQGADDFTVPANTEWAIDRVFIDGFSYVSDVVTTVNVFFYSNSGGPGALQCSYMGVTPTSDVLSDLTIDLASPCALQDGVYWVSVQANLPSIEGEWWYWSYQEVSADLEAQWQNPGDWFSSGCTTWSPVHTVCGGSFSDFTFQLYGYASTVDDEEPADDEPLPDGDGDGVADVYDNCLYIANPHQEDGDSDGIGDACDYPVWVLLGCPNEVLTHLGYSGVDGDVACRETLAEDEWDVPAAPAGYSYAVDPTYEAYYTVFGIDAVSGSGMTSLADPLTVCFSGGLGASAIGVYYDNLPVSGPEWMLLDTFAMNGDLCATTSQLGYFAAFFGS